MLQPRRITTICVRVRVIIVTVAVVGPTGTGTWNLHPVETHFASQVAQGCGLAARVVVELWWLLLLTLLQLKRLLPFKLQVPVALLLLCLLLRLRTIACTAVGSSFALTAITIIATASTISLWQRRSC